ncbi:hypothetical protein AC578_3998 [Pseudocercospora eumusae]|uniref:Uncharacterized protein n=1 Tax=Pseudocercospora eumusae TaxID=321146 RepID=A0A139HLS5_9PEZI|nr:hypothetical protein AC578_3998 [Pseudocercospora eumusae]
MASRRLRRGRPPRNLGSSPPPTHSIPSSEFPFPGFGAQETSARQMSRHSLPKSVGSRVAAIPKLLEHILLYTKPVHGRCFWLLRVERVSRAFRNGIEGSKYRLLLCPPAEKKAEIKMARDGICDEPEGLWSCATGNSSGDTTGNHYLTVEFDCWDELRTILSYKESSLRRTYFNENTYCVTQAIVFAGSMRGAPDGH